ncbi:hypothetical protein FACS1894152_1410 [Bacilli bacterium]|nr:hypothetical protein FACS1894152_1410 [Bacilli bacterium]
MVNRKIGRWTVLSYKIKKIVNRLPRLVFVVLLSRFTYLGIADRGRLSMMFSGLVKSVVTIIKSNYSGKSCYKFTIEGVKYADYGKIENYAEKYCLGSEFDLNKLKSILIGDPWIKKLTLQKNIRGLLKIIIVEHSPFAIFTSDYKTYILVNELGEKINIPNEKITNFNYLFTIVDNYFDLEEINSLFNVLSMYYGVAKNILTFVRVGDRRWNFILKNNILVKMPEDDGNSMEVWTMLNKLLDTYGLDIGLEEIDLRIEGRAFLKYRTETRSKIEEFSRNFSHK